MAWIVGRLPLVTWRRVLPVSVGLDHRGIDSEALTTDEALSNAPCGPGTDEPLVWYEGSGTATRRYLHADERGSLVAVSDSSGTSIAVNRYDEYGQPQGGTVTGRFGYTGQAWLPEVGLQYFKARMYHPRLGRFLQSDPVGYEAGQNIYGYVGGDPVNATDPSGMCEAEAKANNCYKQWSAPGTGTNIAGYQAKGAPVYTVGYANPAQSGSGGVNTSGGSSNAIVVIATVRADATGGNLGSSPGAQLFTVGLDTNFTIGSGWMYRERDASPGFPFYALRPNPRAGASPTFGIRADTQSYNRAMAFASAKGMWDIASSAQPIKTWYAGSLEGRNIGLDVGNVRYYMFTNIRGALIGIREDLGTAYQPPHFNAGPGGSIGNPNQSLPTHHYFPG